MLRIYIKCNNNALYLFDCDSVEHFFYVTRDHCISNKLSITKVFVQDYKINDFFTDKLNESKSCILCPSWIKNIELVPIKSSIKKKYVF
jgi:hypothetical protein